MTVRHFSPGNCIGKTDLGINENHLRLRQIIEHPRVLVIAIRGIVFFDGDLSDFGDHRVGTGNLNPVLRELRCAGFAPRFIEWLI